MIVSGARACATIRVMLGIRDSAVLISERAVAAAQPNGRTLAEGKPRT